MSVISLNGNSSLKQPSTLKEELIHKVHDNTSVNGKIRRTWLADKYQVEMTFSGVNQAEYAALAPYLFNGANAVTYANAVTGVNFTGFATKSVDTFLPGNSWLKNLTVTIQQT